jgi:hypothetical protein
MPCLTNENVCSIGRGVGVGLGVGVGVGAVVPTKLKKKNPFCRHTDIRVLSDSLFAVDRLMSGTLERQQI